MKAEELPFRVGDYFIWKPDPKYRCYVSHLTITPKGAVLYANLRWSHPVRGTWVHRHRVRFVTRRIAKGFLEPAEGPGGVF